MGFPRTGPAKFKLFNHSRWTHKIFRVGKYKKKRFPKRGSPKLKLFNLLNWIHEMVVHKFSTFLFETTFAFLHHQLLPKDASPVQT